MSGSKINPRSIHKTRVPNILFACRFPPPYTGQAIGSKLVYDLVKDNYYCNYLNILLTRYTGMGGRFSLAGIIKTFKNLFVFRREISKDNYNLVYFVPASSSLGHIRDIALVFLLAGHSSKIIAHVRSGNFQNLFRKKYMVFFNNFFLSRVDKFIFLSRYLSNASAAIPENKKVVIQNPIDDDVIFTEEECIKKVSAKKNDSLYNIVFLSNMIESKGYWDLAKALTLLPADFFWKAHFVGDWGDKKQRSRFVKYLVDNGISEQVAVYGRISDRLEIKEMYRLADIFVLPTYYPVEAQPRSIIEAMNAATPVIATRHASIPEYVENGCNGFLINKQSPDEIADAVEGLSDRRKWAEFAVAARKTYLEQFSTKIIQKQLISLFQQHVNEI